MRMLYFTVRTSLQLRRGACSNRALLPGSLNILVSEAEKPAKHFFGVLAEKRRTLNVGRRIRQFDWIADGQILPALRLIDFDNRPGLPERRLLGQFFHRED